MYTTLMQLQAYTVYGCTVFPELEMTVLLEYFEYKCVFYQQSSTYECMGYIVGRSGGLEPDWFL